MEKINAVITGVGGYVPDYILTNDEISKMVDTNDEWIMTRIGVKERHILNEEGLGTSYMARKAAKQLMQRTGSNPDDIDLVIVATSTPDYQFPSIASILCDKLGLKNAFAFDMSAACCGFLYMMETAANRITSASSTAINTCLRISSSKISSEFTTQPPVSTTENSRPSHSDFPYWRSRVVPASSLTIACLVLVRRLNNVDFPTLGRPTIATKFPIGYTLCFLRLSQSYEY